MVVRYDLFIFTLLFKTQSLLLKSFTHLLLRVPNYVTIARPKKNPPPPNNIYPSYSRRGIENELPHERFNHVVAFHRLVGAASFRFLDQLFQRGTEVWDEVDTAFD